MKTLLQFSSFKILLLLLSLVTVIQAEAQTVVSNTTYTINSTLPTSGTNFQTLPEAITALNATVPSPVNVVFSIVDATISLPDAQVIKNPVTIKGNTVNANGSPAIVIYQSNSKYHFHDSIFANNLVIQDLVLIGPNATFTGGVVASTGTNTTGGGVFAVTTSGLLTIKNCIVGGCYDLVNGGGVLAGKPLQLENTTFSYNKTGGSGGGVYAFAALTLKGANVFTNNTAEGQFGGAIHKHVSGAFTTTDLTSLVVDGNTSNFGGGGIFTYVALDITTAQSVSITNNKTLNGDGGGIYAVNTLALANAVISNNIAAGNGGGIYAIGVIDIKNATFTNNNATAATTGNAANANGNGGAIYSTGGGTISNSILINNLTNATAVTGENTGGNGGGIYSSANLTLTDVAITSNQANATGTNASNKSGNGGGIYTSVGADLTLDNTTISGNKATGTGGTTTILSGCGGGVFATGSLILKRDVLFEKDTALNNGGAICNVKAATIFDVSGITSFKVINNLTLNATNTGFGLGGGIYSEGDLKLENGDNNEIEITNNTAGGHGGAIYSKAALTLKNTTISDCKANYNPVTQSFSTTSNGGHGGAIYATKKLSIAYSSLFNNKTENSHGGAIYAADTLILDHSTINRNTVVNGNGGGVYKAGTTTGTIDVTKSTFAENIAIDGAGIYTTTTTAATISNSTFSQNNATNSGGGIYSSANNAVVKTVLSTFNGNLAATSGSALYFANATNKTLNGNIIYGNGTGSEIQNAPTATSYNITKTALSGSMNKTVSAGKADSIFTTVTGDVATLESNGGTTQTLNIQEGGFAHNFIPTNIANTWDASTTDQRDSVRSVDCKTDAGSVEIQILEIIPIPVVKTNTPICYNTLLNADTLIVSASDMKDTLYYSDKNYTTEMSPMPVTITTQNKIYVKFIATSNCELYDTISFNIIPKPTLNFNSRTVTICSDSSVNLIATTTNSAGILWTNYSSTGSATGETTDTLHYTANPRTTDTTFYIFATVQGNSPCESYTDTVTMTVKGRPTAVISNLSATSICASDLFRFTLTTTNSGYVEVIGGAGTIQPIRKSTSINYANYTENFSYEPKDEKGDTVQLIIKTAGDPCGYLFDTLRIFVFPDVTNMGFELVDEPKGIQQACVDTVYTLKVRAVALGALDSIRVTLNDSYNTNIVVDSAEYKYPYTTGNWQKINNYQYIGIDHTYLLPNPLPGSDSVMVRFHVKATCGFSSGNSVNFLLNAKDVCNNVIPQPLPLTSQPYRLSSDANFLNSYTFENTINNTASPLVANSRIGDTLTVRVKAIIVAQGGTPTDSLTERLVTQIPKGLEFVPNSMVPVRNAGGSYTSEENNDGVFYDLVVPSGILNDSIIYEFKVFVGDAPCDQYNLYAEAYYLDSVFCDTACISYNIIEHEDYFVNIERYSFSLLSNASYIQNGNWYSNLTMKAVNGFFAGDSLKVDFYVDLDSNSRYTSGVDTIVKTHYIKTATDIDADSTLNLTFSDISVTPGYQLVVHIADPLLCDPLQFPVTIITGTDTACQNTTTIIEMPMGMTRYHLDAISGATRVPLTSVGNYPKERFAQIRFTTATGLKNIIGGYSRINENDTIAAENTTFKIYVNPAVSFKRLRTADDTVCSPSVATIYADTVLNASSRLWTASAAVGSLSGETTDTLTYNLLPRTNDTTIWIYFTAYGLESCGDKTDSIKLTVYATLQQGIPVDTTLCYGNSYTFKFLAATGGLNNTYQWQDSTKSNAWADISLNATDTNYTTPILTDSTWYRRIVTNSCGLKDTSSIAIVAVLPEFSASNVRVILPACMGDSTTVSFEAVNGISPYSYSFDDLHYTIMSIDSTTQTGNSALHFKESFSGGNYYFSLKDSAGCSVENILFIVLPNSPSVEPKTDVLFVKTKPSGTGDGSSWDDAFDGKYLAWYLRNKATAGTQIYVAEGIYTPYVADCDTMSNIRKYSFELNHNMQMKGGYDSLSTGTDFNTYEPKINITRLSGEIQSDGNSVNNSYHVVTVAKNMSIQLDGFYVSGGYAYDAGGDNLIPHGPNGGGIYDDGDNTAASVVYSHLVIENNGAKFGGGVYLQKNRYSIFQNVTIQNNTNIEINYGGAGIFAWGNFVLENSTVNNNIHGSGVLSWGGDMLIRNSTISGNERYGIEADNGSFGDKIRFGLINTTVANNNVGVYLKNHVQDSLTISFDNTLIIGNTNNIDIDDQYAITPVTFAYTIIGNTKYISQTDIHPLSIPVALAALADNGGWGKTHALLNPCENPAVQSGDPIFSGGLDQRDTLRSDPPCIGAYDGLETIQITLASNAQGDSVCYGNSVTIDAEVQLPTDRYVVNTQWYKDEVALSEQNSNSLVISNVTFNDAGKYTVLITTDDPTCSRMSDTLNLHVNEMPTINMKTDTTIICSGIAVELDTLVLNPNNYELSFYETLTGGTALTSSEVSPSVTKTYYVEAKNTTTQCVSSPRDSIVVKVNFLPQATISDDKNEVCAGESANIIFTLTVGKLLPSWSVEYEENGITVNPSPEPNNSNTNTITVGVFPTINTTYTIKKVIDGNGCVITYP